MPPTKAVGGGIYSGVFDKDVKVPVKIMRRSSLVPLLPTIWSVTIDQTGTMFCSCKHFERIGLPCVHLVCVATLCHETSVFGSHTSKFSGFTHHYIVVRWWSSYMYYAYRSSTPLHIIEKYHLLAMNPIRGPKMRCMYHSSWKYMTHNKICLQ
jgi:hypothetical protein